MEPRAASRIVLVYADAGDREGRRRITSLASAVLAEYDGSVLVAATDEQVAALDREGYGVSVQRDADEIHIGAFTFATAEPLAREAVARRADTEPYAIVQFMGSVNDAWKTALVSLGIEFVEFVPRHGFLVRIPAGIADAVAALPFVRWIGPFLPQYKISPRLLVGGRRRVTASEGLDVQVDPGAAPLDPKGNLQVTVIKAAAAYEAAAAVEALGGVVIERSGTQVVIALDPARVVELATVPSVWWISRYVAAQLTNTVSVDLVNVRAVRDGTAPLGLLGTGQIVAVTDTGLDATHPDIATHVVAGYSYGRPTGKQGGPGLTDDPVGHGTHVIGSILGDGSASSDQVKGMAPEARVVIQSMTSDDFDSGCETPPGVSPPVKRFSERRFSIPSDFTPLLEQGYGDGARVHNNSWTTRGGEYDPYARQVDAFVAQHRDYVVLFGSGNDGEDRDRDGIVDRDSMGGPATAKNCIAVGATEGLRLEATPTWEDIRYCPPRTADPPDADSSCFPISPLRSDRQADNPHGLAAFSSRGPTNDGRIKPDLVAPGTSILSTRSTTSTRAPLGPDGKPASGGHYAFSSGTSMATSITAGAVVLLRQFLVDRKAHQPSAALVKALLINAAQPLRGQYTPPEIGAVPNDDCGWGLVNLREALAPSPPRIVWLHDRWADPALSLATGAAASFTITVTDPAEPLKATLVWTDPAAGLAAAGPRLVNDLDLEIAAPDGTTHLGNAGHYPAGSPYLSTDGRDRCNTVEGVVIEAPSTGSYTVHVRAHLVPSGPQDYALVLSGAFTPPTATGTTIP
jgi:subtilisin family serine protease